MIRVNDLGIVLKKQCHGSSDTDDVDRLPNPIEDKNPECIFVRMLTRNFHLGMMIKANESIEATANEAFPENMSGFGRNLHTNSAPCAKGGKAMVRGTRESHLQRLQGGNLFDNAEIASQSLSP